MGQRGGQDNALSREELRTLLSEAGAMIPKRSQTMLLAILDLGQVTVEDIMILRNEVDVLDIRDSEEEVINRIKNAAYTRLPLFDGDIDNVISIIHVRDALHTLLDRGLGKEHLRAIGRRPFGPGAHPRGNPPERGREPLDRLWHQRARAHRALRWKLSTSGPKTLNGLIIEHMEAIPEPGTSLKLGGHAIEIIHTAESAVKTVKYIHD